MTSVKYSDSDMNECFITEVYKVPRIAGDSLKAIISKEKMLSEMIITNGGNVKEINSTLISKRRYKRRKAKELKRLAMKHRVIL